MFDSIFSRCVIFLFTFFILLTFLFSGVDENIKLLGKLIVLFTISWKGAYFVKRFLPKRQISSKNRIVLISGCDSGFGFNTAKRLDSYGFHVFAGCMFPEGPGAKSLISQTSDKLKIVKLDVTSEDDIKAVVEEIKKSNLELWGVVNNAGIHIGDFIEEGKSMDAWRKVFDVNVFGVVALTRHCLPLLRKSCGRVVVVASLLGRLTIPGTPIYCMSKHAVRSFSDSLRREMRHFKINVSCIEPSLYATNITNTQATLNMLNNRWAETDDEVRQTYGENFLKSLKNKIEFTLTKGSKNLYEVVDAIEDGLVNEEPQAYYKPSRYAERFIFDVLQILPESLQDFIISPGAISYGLRFLKNKLYLK